MKGFLNSIFGDYSEREVKRIQPIVDKIMALDEEISKLSDEKLREKTEEFKSRLKKNEELDDILVEAFAVVREAAYRVLGMKHYRVQLVGGIVLHQGRIAEMKTGEGKTLVGTLPAYLNALEGKGVHIITSNEYLAVRDCKEMGKIHEFLGLTVGVIIHEMETDERREIYNYDISYGVNSEVGFDYLKDNMVTKSEERVQRGLNYVIIDEIDSILIDEARTPLIISGQGEEATEYYVNIDRFVKTLKKDIDYEMDEKQKAVTILEEGIENVEKSFKIENFADMENIKLNHHITQALKANFAMIKDIDYIENDEEEIQIVDTFTGRVMEGRRFSDGLHQAIEAKEEVEIEAESKTLATITLQNLFRGYSKICGMSGTVVSEEKEFMDVYNVDVVLIPTNKKIQRHDKIDKVYSTLHSKYMAIIEEIIKTNKKGQPILVGTASIQKSEDISALLKRRGIKHNVLNAKNHKNEAMIISKAGNIGAITIATNMAGRGTDIKLTSETEALGGLKVIGTERHDSVRIDNQLRGRAGRQGDVGISEFYVSLEDDMIKNFMSAKYKKILEKLNINEDKKIIFKHINKVVTSAQSAVEDEGFASRKNVVGYDDALNKQREIIYKQRNIVLDNESIEANIISMVDNFVSRMVDENISLADSIMIEELERIETLLAEIGCDIKLVKSEFSDYEIDELKEVLSSLIKENYREKRKLVNEDIKEIEKQKVLEIVDEKWIEYMTTVEYLKMGIGLRSYKQQDPVLAFQMESSEMFIEMNNEIQESVVKSIYLEMEKLI